MRASRRIIQIVVTDSSYAVYRTEEKKELKPLACLALVEQFFDGAPVSSVVGIVTDGEEFVYADFVKGFQGYTKVAYDVRERGLKRAAAQKGQEFELHEDRGEYEPRR